MNWKTVNFRCLFQVKHGFAFKSSFFSDKGDFIILTPGHFFEKGGFRVNKNQKYYTGDFPVEYLLLKDDLLIVMTEQSPGLLGSPLLIPENNKYLHNQRLGLIEKIDKEKIFKSFLYHLFNSEKVRKQISISAGGTKVRHSSPDKILDVLINLPPINQQKKIAEILTTWDEAIALTEKAIKTKNKSKKALLKALVFGEKKLPNFVNNSWQNTNLKKIGKIVSGGTPDTDNSNYWNGDIFWCTPSEITVLQSRYISSTEKHLTEIGLKNSSANLLPPYSLVVCTRATVGSCAITTVPMATNQGFKSIIPNPDISVEYLYYLMCCLKHELIKLGSGSTFLEVSKKDFENIKICIPLYDEQKAIAEVLNICDSEIQIQKKLLSNLQNQKRGLMQKLLTGEWLVPVPETND